jgi:hypothetical protein
MIEKRLLPGDVMRRLLSIRPSSRRIGGLVAPTGPAAVSRSLPASRRCRSVVSPGRRRPAAEVRTPERLVHFGWPAGMTTLSRSG